jgi:hypothetical protein
MNGKLPIPVQMPIPKEPMLAMKIPRVEKKVPRKAKRRRSIEIGDSN